MHVEHSEECISQDAIHVNKIHIPTQSRYHNPSQANLLIRAIDWIEDKGYDKRVFWVHGPSRSGKTSICETLADILHHRHKLSATFFFRQYAKQTPRMLFPTIIHQLSMHAEKVWSVSALQEIKKRIHGLERWEENINNHLSLFFDAECFLDRAQSKHLPFIGYIVLDGIDTFLPGPDVLHSVIHNYAKLPFRIIVFTESSPNPQLTRVPYYSVVDIQLEQENLPNNVYVRLHDGFDRIPVMNWPDFTVISSYSNVLARLARHSRKQTAYDQTILKYIRNGYFSPTEQLKHLFSILESPDNSRSGLDRLYYSILTACGVTDSQLASFLAFVFLKDRESRSVQLCTVPVAFQLFDIPLADAQRTVGNLQALTALPSPKDVYNIICCDIVYFDDVLGEFIEFLYDKERSGSYFIGDLVTSHAKILDACIKIIMTPPEEHIHEENGEDTSCTYLGWYYAVTSWLQHWKSICNLNSKNLFFNSKPTLLFITKWMSIILWEHDVLPEDFKICPIMKQFNSSLYPFSSVLTFQDEMFLLDEFDFDVSVFRDSSYVLNHRFMRRVQISKYPEGLMLIIGTLVAPLSVFGIPTDFLKHLPWEPQISLEQCLQTLRPFLREEEQSTSSGHKGTITLAPYSGDASLLKSYKLDSHGHEFWLIHLLGRARELCTDILLEDYISFLIYHFENSSPSEKVIDQLQHSSAFIAEMLLEEDHPHLYHTISVWLYKSDSPLPEELVDRWNMRSKQNIALKAV
ncbi:hypothetical protein BDQ12DRAFT_716158 [Crucibulum laeve]|uniref:Nephrocystin 3-like N-terminal domain-containing protein n=1 Tax=Crucibulum laeve TaxID=68775 RepID=A0A5C3LLV0_9AGAR|nr:hypothetical protein BDQ12DRAFT_716158 [Crucibulum laeve]